jgi:hypothetical protein
MKPLDKPALTVDQIDALAEHLASWAGMCLGNAESGGRRLSGRTRHPKRLAAAHAGRGRWRWPAG